MSFVSKPENVILNNLVYSAPKSNNNGGQFVFVNDMARNKIRINTPKCFLPFGVSEFNGNYSIPFSLNSDDIDGINSFKKFLKSFDEYNCKIAEQNSQQWFKKTYNLDTITELYNPTLKQSNKDYPPIFKAKLPFKNGNLECSIYDNERNLITLGNVKKGCYVEAIIECNGIYFVSKEFGVSWKIVQLKVYPTEEIKGYSFLDDD